MKFQWIDWLFCGVLVFGCMVLALNFKLIGSVFSMIAFSYFFLCAVRDKHCLFGIVTATMIAYSALNIIHP